MFNLLKKKCLRHIELQSSIYDCFSVDKDKMNNMIVMNKTKSWDDKKLGDKVSEKDLDIVQLDV